MHHGWLVCLLLGAVSCLPSPSAHVAFFASPSSLSSYSLPPLLLAELKSETRGNIEGAFPALPLPPSERQLVTPRFKSVASTSNLLKTGVTVQGSQLTSLTDGDEQRRKTEAEGLANALSQLSIDISGASQTVISEDRWVQDVQKVMDQYTRKIANVKTDIESQRANIKKMLKTKRKVENLILQKQLEDKLAEASNDLVTINSAINQVHVKGQSLTRSSGDVEAAIAAIKGQIAKLQGKNADATSSTSGTSSTESSDTSGDNTPTPSPS